MPALKACITGVSAYVPPHKLTNAMLETMVDTNDEWIVSRTGIQERRILKDKDLATSDMASEPVKQLLAKKGIDVAKVEWSDWQKQTLRHQKVFMKIGSLKIKMKKDSNSIEIEESELTAMPFPRIISRFLESSE